MFYNLDIGKGVQSPLITTLIPTFRRPHYLRRALKSIVNQTFRDFQVCVYDNHSGDDTPAVVHNFEKEDPRIRYFCHPKNIGMLANYHYAMSQVKTPFFSVLMDDDILLPHCYQTAMEGFKRYPDALFSGGACIVMTEQGEVMRMAPSLWQRREGYFMPPEGLYEMLGPHLHRHIVNTSLVFKREVFEKVGYMDFRDGVNAEIDYILRIAAKFGFALSREPSAIFVIQSGSFWIGQPSFPKYHGCYQMLRNLTDDACISSQVRSRVGSLFKEQIKQGTHLLASFAFLRRRFEDTKKLADALERDFNLKREASLLREAIAASEKSPHLHCRLHRKLEKQLLAAFNYRPDKRLQEKYGSYAKYLTL